MGELTCRRLIASPALDINSLELKGLNLFEEAPRAEPHAGCCGSGGRKSPCYPIMRCLTQPIASQLRQTAHLKRRRTRHSRTDLNPMRPVTSHSQRSIFAKVNTDKSARSLSITLNVAFTNPFSIPLMFG